MKTREAIYLENHFGIKLYKNQLKAASLATKRNAIQMGTGEGKTYSVYLTVLYKLKTCKQVFVVTSNSYLANRDFQSSYLLFKNKGYTSTVLNKTSTNIKDYNVVFSAPEDLVFYYLRGYPMLFESAVIDEIDYVLVENALSNFSVSLDEEASEYETISIDDLKIGKSLSEIMQGKYLDMRIASIDEELKSMEYDFVYNDMQVWITTKGYLFLGSFMNSSNFIEEYPFLVEVISKFLYCKLFLKEGLDYLIKDEKINVLNRYNGRVSVNSQYDFLVQTILEFLNDVPITKRTSRGISINYGVFFSRFKSLSGFSGTVSFFKRDFEQLHYLGVRKMKSSFNNKIVVSHSDLYETKTEKNKEIIRYIKKNPNKSILVCTYDEKSLCDLIEEFKKYDVPAEVLDNFNLEMESEKIKLLGESPRVLISTKIVSRGVHIDLSELVLKNGGLVVILTEHYDFKSIDRQVIGRSQRQGQIGEAIIFRSKEDNIFLNKRLDEKMLSVHSLNKKVSDLQLKNSNQGFDIRKSSLIKSKFIDGYVETLKKYLSCLNYEDQIGKISDLQQGISTIWDNSMFINNVADRQFIITTESESLLNIIKEEIEHA